MSDTEAEMQDEAWEPPIEWSLVVALYDRGGDCEVYPPCLRGDCCDPARYVATVAMRLDTGEPGTLPARLCQEHAVDFIEHVLNAGPAEIV